MQRSPRLQQRIKTNNCRDGIKKGHLCPAFRLRCPFYFVKSVQRKEESGFRMTTVILVRHGESEANIQGVFAGHYNIPLTEKGHAQAEATARFLSQYPIDKIYASDLRRAYCTAEHIAAKKDLPVISEPGLREINGGKWEAVPFRALAERFPEDYAHWCSNLAACRCPGGESIAELQSRIRHTIEMLVAQNPGKMICLATHATPIRVMKCIWEGWSLSEIANIPWVSNASVSIVEYRERGAFRILCYGADSHLEGSRTALPDEI